MKSVSVVWIEPDGEFEATSTDHPMFSASAPTPEEAVRELQYVTRAKNPESAFSGGLLPANSALLRIRAPRAFERTVKRAAARRGVSVETFVLSALVRAVTDESGHATR